MAEVIRDIEPIRMRLQEAAPKGWYIAPATIEHALDARQGYPDVLYEVQAIQKRDMGKRGKWITMRSVEVRLRAASVETLEAAVKALPHLEPMLELPMDTEVHLDTYDD